MFLYQHFLQKLPWSNDSPEPTQQNQTGFSNDKPSYAAILKLDLEDAGTPPAPIQPPSHVPTSKAQSGQRVSETSTIPSHGEHDPPTQPSTSDLRAPCQPFKRHRTRLKKHFSFKIVHRGQLHQRHISDHDPLDPYPPIKPLYALDDPRCPVTVLKKRMLFEEAQRPPKPPKWHRSHRWEMVSWDGKGRRGVGRAVSRREMLVCAGAYEG